MTQNLQKEKEKKQGSSNSTGKEHISDSDDDSISVSSDEIDLKNDSAEISNTSSKSNVAVKVEKNDKKDSVGSGHDDNIDSDGLDSKDVVASPIAPAKRGRPRKINTTSTAVSYTHLTLPTICSV